MNFILAGYDFKEVRFLFLGELFLTKF